MPILCPSLPGGPAGSRQLVGRRRAPRLPLGFRAAFSAKDMPQGPPAHPGEAPLQPAVKPRAMEQCPVVRATLAWRPQAWMTKGLGCRSVAAKSHSRRAHSRQAARTLGLWCRVEPLLAKLLPGCAPDLRAVRQRQARAKRSRHEAKVRHTTSLSRPMHCRPVLRQLCAASWQVSRAAPRSPPPSGPAGTPRRSPPPRRARPGLPPG
mmetsp:Transcript_41716/g.116278  ORF Transcript_41716/g.116278 Transcript_41716/m.116278 type:complete len:207 (+) Transcript_41716:86-706(+)